MVFIWGHTLLDQRFFVCLYVCPFGEPIDFFGWTDGFSYSFFFWRTHQFQCGLLYFPVGALEKARTFNPHNNTSVYNCVTSSRMSFMSCFRVVLELEDTLDLRETRWEEMSMRYNHIQTTFLISIYERSLRCTLFVRVSKFSDMAVTLGQRTFCFCFEKDKKEAGKGCL